MQNRFPVCFLIASCQILNMMWYLILLFGFLSFPASTAIVEGPKNSVFPEGSNVTLTCLANMENTVVWEDINENTVIFIRKGKNTKKEKFDNFFISDAEGNYSLTIVNAQVSDDGFYSCEEGDERRNANLTVEAVPHLSIFVNNSELVSGKRMKLREDEEAYVLCKAVGAKPAVRLELKFGDNDWVTTRNAITNEGLLFTTEIMVVHRFVRNDTTITCRATGQVSISPTISLMSLDMLHKPACLIELDEDVAECKCKSNPPVSSHSWYINGELKSTEHSLSIRDYVPENITCSAVNAIGTGPLTSKYVFLKDIQSDDSTKLHVVTVVVTVVVIVVFIGIMIVMVLILLIHRKRFQECCRGNGSVLCFKDKFQDASDVFLQPQDTSRSTPLTTINENTTNHDEGSPVDQTVEETPLVRQDGDGVINNDPTTIPMEHKDDQEDLISEEGHKYHDPTTIPMEHKADQEDLSSEEGDNFQDARETVEENEEGNISLDPKSESAINDNGGTPAEKSEEKSLFDLGGENEDTNKDTGTENDGTPVDPPKVGDSP